MLIAKKMWQYANSIGDEKSKAYWHAVADYYRGLGPHPDEIESVSFQDDPFFMVFSMFNGSGEARAVYMTTKEATKAAARLGFTKTNYLSKGRAVFTNGDVCITPDIDGHNGGVWKMANSVKNLLRKETRMGTYDTNLNRIGD